MSKIGFISSDAMPSFNIPTFDSSAHIKREDPYRVMKGNVWTQQQKAAINITPPRSLGQSCLWLQPRRRHTLDPSPPSAGETEGSSIAAQTFYTTILTIKTSLLRVFLKSCAFRVSQPPTQAAGPLQHLPSTLCPSARRNGRPGI